MIALFVTGLKPLLLLSAKVSSLPALSALDENATISCFSSLGRVLFLM